MLKTRLINNIVVMISLLLCHVLVLAMSGNPASRGDNKKPTGKSYLLELKQLQGIRQDLSRRMQKASSSAERGKILQQARRKLQDAIVNKMIPHWYGTIWAFHGTTTKPRQGTIACGYFVTTVLKQSGMPINRVRLAQMASETMIRRLMPVSSIKRFPGATFKSFLQALVKWGDGLYIVGLDNHTGFILRENNQSWFIHSSYELPLQVVREKAEKSSILAGSRYRVLGKLFVSDPEILRWLTNK